MIRYLPEPLRDLVALTAPPASRLAGLRPSSDAAWERVVSAAEKHRLVLPLLSRLPDHGVPAGPRGRLKAAAERLARRSLVATAELIRLTRRFEGAGIPVLTLKGPALALQIHGQVAARDPGDLDLLIDPAHLAAADRLLQESGYQRPADCPNLAGTGLAVLLRATAGMDYRRDRGIKVGLHWRWHRNPALMRLGGPAMWARARRLDLGGNQVAVPDSVDQLVYLASHGARHLWRRLRWLDDLRWLLADPATADLLPMAVERARDLGAARALACALALVQGLDDLPLPPSAMTAIAESGGRRLARYCLRSMPTLPRPVDVGGLRTDVMAGWLLADNWRDRLQGLVLNRLIGPSERDAAAVHLPPRWQGLYPVIRPILWAVRQVVKWR